MSQSGAIWASSFAMLAVCSFWSDDSFGNHIRFEINGRCYSAGNISYLAESIWNLSSISRLYGKQENLQRANDRQFVKRCAILRRDIKFVQYYCQFGNYRFPFLQSINLAFTTYRPNFIHAQEDSGLVQQITITAARQQPKDTRGQN